MAEATFWPREPARTAAVARALYLYQAPGTDLWLAPGSYRRADVTVLHGLLAHGRAPMAADATADYIPGGRRGAGGVARCEDKRDTGP